MPPVSQAIEQLVTRVPEAREHYPMTIVMDKFADQVRDWVCEGASNELLDRCFATIEHLAASEDVSDRNLVSVCFLEAAAWGELGVAGRFGPATRRLITEADPRMIDPALVPYGI
jgi:hypothetical protein